MARFKIEFKDPETQEPRIEYVDFEATGNVSAAEWAEDRAYTLADKGQYTVTEVRRG